MSWIYAKPFLRDPHIVSISLICLVIEAETSGSIVKICFFLFVVFAHKYINLQKKLITAGIK